MHKDNLSLFKTDLNQAFLQLSKEFQKIKELKNEDPGSGLHPHPHSLYIKAAARCGCAVAAAVKRAKRRHVLNALCEAHSLGMDITPSVAQGTAQRLLGRGFDSLETMRLFSTPGRTAANKTKVTSTDLSDLEKRIAQDLTDLLVLIEKAKDKARKKWAEKRKAMGV